MPRKSSPSPFQMFMESVYSGGYGFPVKLGSLLHDEAHLLVQDGKGHRLGPRGLHLRKLGPEIHIPSLEGPYTLHISSLVFGSTVTAGFVEAAPIWGTL